MMSAFSQSLLWGLFERSPIGIARALLRTLLGREYISKVKRHGRSRLAARLGVAEILANQNNSAWDGVIIIGGAARIGKTTVARAVARKIGGRVVRFDRLRKYYRDLDPDETIYIKSWMIDELCRKGKGIIIEGDELITHARPNLLEKLEVFPVTAELIRDMMDRWGAWGFCLGDTEDSPDEKHQGLQWSARRHKCWAAGQLNESDLHMLSSIIVSTSRELRNKSEQLDVPYVEISGSNFKESVAEATKMIAEMVKSR